MHGVLHVEADLSVCMCFYLCVAQHECVCGRCCIREREWMYEGMDGRMDVWMCASTPGVV